MVAAILSLLVMVVLMLVLEPDRNRDFALTGVALGCASVGLGFISIGIAHKSDERYTTLLTRINENVLSLLANMEAGDMVEVAGKELSIPPTTARGLLGRDASKALAQKRLDEDTKKVGWQKGRTLPTSRWAMGHSLGWEVSLVASQVLRLPSAMGRAALTMASGLKTASGFTVQTV